MAALTDDRNTLRRDGALYAHPVATNVKIYAGALVVLNAGHYAAPATTATGLRAIGVARRVADNTGGANGAINVEVEAGVFKFANLGGDAVTRVNIGSNCYAADDQTVAATDGTGTRSVAGVVKDVDSDGVWVKIG